MRGQSFSVEREGRARRGSSYAAGVMLAVAIALWIASAQAQDCPPLAAVPQRALEVTPTVGARGVTLDAPVVFLYAPGYFEVPGDPPETLVSIESCGPVPCDLGAGVPVPGRVQVLGDRLFFLADGGLRPGTAYVGVARGADGEFDCTFTTGSATDELAPDAPQLVFGGSVPASPCSLPEGGFRVDFTLPRLRDDGPQGSIEYLLFLTRGAGVTGPQLRVRVRNFQAEEIPLVMLLDNDEAAEPVCVRAVAIDGVGRVSPESSELCVDPVVTAAFQPLCAAHAGGRSRSGLVGVAFLAAVWLARRRTAA